MGRPPRYAEAEILEGAKHVSAEVGPGKLTIARIAKRTGMPVGSIYHRYASRDAILAEVWLELVEEFQEQFLAELGAANTVQAGLAAVRFACRWIRLHPREARLLLLHRREDFASDRWPTSYRRRAEALAGRGAAALGDYAARLTSQRGAAVLRTVRFALIDLPTSVLRRDVEAGTPPPEAVEDLLVDTCAHVLRRAARAIPKPKSKRR